MSDRSATQITIGGPLTRDNLARVARAVLLEAGIGTDWESGFAHFQEAETAFLKAAEAQETITLLANEAPGGRFGALEATLRGLGLSYHRSDDGHYAYGPEHAAWEPGMDKPVICTGNIESGGAVPLDVLSAHLSNGDSLQAVLNHYRLINNIPGLVLIEDGEATSPTGQHRWYVSMTWDEFPEGGSYSTVVAAQDHAEAKRKCRIEMARARILEQDGEGDPEEVMREHEDDWIVIDCMDLDQFLERLRGLRGPEHDIATNSGEFTPLDDAEIDELIEERLNVSGVGCWTVLLLRPDWQRGDEASESDWLYRSHEYAGNAWSAARKAQARAARSDDQEHDDDQVLDPDEFAIMAVYPGHLMDVHDPQDEGGPHQTVPTPYTVLFGYPSEGGVVDTFLDTVYANSPEEAERLAENNAWNTVCDGWSPEQRDGMTFALLLLLEGGQVNAKHPGGI